VNNSSNKGDTLPSNTVTSTDLHLGGGGGTVANKHSGGGAGGSHRNNAKFSSSLQMTIVIV